MRDIAIDIVFIIGTLAVVFIFLALTMWAFFVIREFAMENKRIFSHIFNREFDKKIKDFSDDDFEKWVKGLRKRVAKKRIEDTAVEKGLFDG